MKRFYLFFGIFAFMAVCSCGNKTQSSNIGDSLAVDSDSIEMDIDDTIAVETQTASRSSKFADVKITMSLPVDEDDEVAQAIRQSLLTLMGRQIYIDADYGVENKIVGAPFKGDTKDLKAVCNFYCQNIFKPLDSENKKEFEQNYEDLEYDGAMTEEQLEQWKKDFPTYAQEIRLTKVGEDENYVVFHDFSYGDRGGAHGGVSGYGYIVFNRTTGKQVKTIIKPSNARKMQRLIKDGLKRYFKQCGQPVPSDKALMEQLFLPEGSNIIPLPQNNGIAPTEDGLVFVYSQYEIAAYAFGMPTFTIPYEKVQDFLTPEAMDLFE